jgi:hypothetical protein
MMLTNLQKVQTAALVVELQTTLLLAHHLELPTKVMAVEIRAGHLLVAQVEVVEVLVA